MRSPPCKPWFATACRSRRACATRASGAGGRQRWSARRARDRRESLRAGAALARLDALSKGIGRGDPWDDLAALALTLAGAPARASTQVAVQRLQR